mgnify:CR=1 FL=1
MKNFIIPLETKVRDYESRLLISIHLLSLSDNTNIFIGERRSIFSSISKLENFVYLSLGVDKQLLFYKNLIKKNGIFTSLDEESAIFTKSTKRSYSRHSMPKNIIKYVTKIFVWGKKDYEKVINQNNQLVNKNKLAICGNPRFDLSKPIFKNFYIKKNTIKDKYILVNCAFGKLNNYVSDEIDSKVWSLRVPGYPSFEKGKKSAIEYEKKLFSLFIDGIKKLVAINSNEIFLLRPHPVENENIYKKIFENYHNVIISKKLSPQCASANAKFLIHNGCTTAIEANFAKINSICYLPYYDEDHIQELTDDVSERIYDQKTLIEKVKSYLDKSLGNKLNNDINNQLIKPFIDNTNYLSYEYIAKEMSNIDQQLEIKTQKANHRKNKFIENLHIFYFKIRNRIINVYLLFSIKDRLNYLNQIKNREKNKLNLELTEIKDDIKDLSSILNLKFEINIIETKKNCFKLFKS